MSLREFLIVAGHQASEQDAFVKASAIARIRALQGLADPKEPAIAVPREPEGLSTRQSVLTFKLDNLQAFQKDWRLKGTFTAGAEGLIGPPTKDRNELESLFKMKGDFEVAISFDCGRAAFTNTGGTWIAVCGEKLEITHGFRGFKADLNVQRKGSKLIFTNNGQVSETEIKPDHLDVHTTFHLFWRTRTSHFHSLKVTADGIVRE